MGEIFLLDDIHSLVVTKVGGRFQAYLTNLPNFKEAEKFFEGGEDGRERVIVHMDVHPQHEPAAKPKSKRIAEVRNVQIVSFPDQGQDEQQVYKLVAKYFGHMHRTHPGGFVTFH